MTTILGLNPAYRESSACLIRDGQIVAVAKEDTMIHLSRRSRNPRLSQKGFVRIQDVIIIVVLIHLVVLFLAWKNAALPKALMWIGFFWLGLILLSALLTGGFWVWDKVVKDPARNQPNTPTLGGDLKIILGLLLTFLSLWAAHGLHKAFMISLIVVGATAGLIILFLIVLFLLPDKKKGPVDREKPGVPPQAAGPGNPAEKP